MTKKVDEDLKTKSNPFLEDDGKLEEFSPLEWTAEEETTLFSVIHERPVGINKAFVMISIAEDFAAAIGKWVPVEVVSDKVNSLYNLNLLEADYDKSYFDTFEEFALDASYESIKVETPQLKDYTRQKTKKEDSPPETPVAGSPEVSDEEDQPLKPTKLPRKSKAGAAAATPTGDAKTSSKAKRDTPKRGTRSSTTAAKDSTPVSKKVEEEVKKDRPSIGARSLRSRGDDDASTKSSSPAPTPPPSAKRSRRI